MFEHADIRIAFRAKEILKEASTHTIEEKDISIVASIPEVRNLR
jgi:phosphoserine phosphatase